MYDKFLALLERTNMTASKVAKATNINRSTFSHWKSGDYNPKIETLQKIADYFGVPVRYFYGDTKVLISGKKKGRISAPLNGVRCNLEEGVERFTL